MEQRTYVCRVIPTTDLEGRSGIAMSPEMNGPAFRGDGPLSLLCGGCSKVIAAGIDESTLTDIMIVCTCGAANDTNLV